MKNSRVLKENIQENLIFNNSGNAKGSSPLRISFQIIILEQKIGYLLRGLFFIALVRLFVNFWFSS